MSAKVQPIGICDHCGERIRRLEWYTRRGPRRYCSLECRQTANSRAGAPIRRDKMLKRVADGAWAPPRSLMTPEQVSETQSRASATARRREVAQNRWRNPGLPEQARQRNSEAQRERMSDPDVRARARANLPRPPDARTSPRAILIDSTLVPDSARSAWVTFADGRLRVRLSDAAVSTARKHHDEPYALGRVGDRTRIEAMRVIRNAGIPAGAWRCVQTGAELVFEPTLV